MSTAVVTPSPGAGSAVTPRDFPAPPIGRLVLVELRKMVDTRSGRWLLVAAVAIGLVIAAVRALVGPEDERTLLNVFQLALFPFGVLLPVLGILTATSEWSQRTALTTFALVPRRTRIARAKLIAALLLGVLAVVACLVLGVIGNLVAITLGGADGSWSISAAQLFQSFVVAELGMLMGLGFGMLLMSPALAIVAYFALPTVFAIVGEIVGGLENTWQWVDSSVAQEPLFEGEASGDDWAKIAVSSLIWIAVPLVLGLLRMNRREVK